MEYSPYTEGKQWMPVLSLLFIVCVDQAKCDFVSPCHFSFPLIWSDVKPRKTSILSGPFFIYKLYSLISILLNFITSDSLSSVFFLSRKALLCSFSFDRLTLPLFFHFSIDMCYLVCFRCYLVYLKYIFFQINRL